MCTHSSPVSAGYLGSRTAAYLSGQWYYSAGKGGHKHRVYVEQISLVGNGCDNSIDWVTTGYCSN